MRRRNPARARGDGVVPGDPRGCRPNIYMQGTHDSRMTDGQFLLLDSEPSICSSMKAAKSRSTGAERRRRKRRQDAACHCGDPARRRQRRPKPRSEKSSEASSVEESSSVSSETSSAQASPRFPASAPASARQAAGLLVRASVPAAVASSAPADDASPHRNPRPHDGRVQLRPANWTRNIARRT